jgi:aminoglycoside phosphotransferase (APT) family kinase protein
MAEVHARLHALPSDGFPAPPGAFLDRSFAEMHSAIVRSGLDGLAPGLEWLQRHRPPQPATPRVVHLDFHPLNLIERADGSLAILDWTYADLGDPHADVATTLLLLECAPVEANGPGRLIAGIGRGLLAALYRRAYQRLRPLNDGRLAYFRAWSALCRLVRYGRWLRSGPAVSGCQATLVEHLAPAFLDSLGRAFRRWSGADVRL